MNTFKKVLSWYKKETPDKIKMSVIEQELQWYKFEGEVGAPPGNSNACKPGVGEGSNCGGGGSPKQTPKNNSKMKEESDKINEDTKNKISQIESIGGDPELKNALIKSVEEQQISLLEDLDEKYNPQIESENQNNRFKTIEESNQYLKNKLNIDGTLNGFDINNGGMNTPNEIINSIEKMYSDFPEKKGMIKKILITSSDKKGPIAIWNKNNGMLEYNSRMSQTGLDKKVKGNLDNHYSVKSPTIKYAIDHEIGHGLVDNYVKINNNKTYITDPDLKSVHDNFIADAKKSSNSQDYYKKNLSGYAQVDSHEFLAEAWAEYRNSPNPRPTAQKIGEIITSKIKKK